MKYSLKQHLFAIFIILVIGTLPLLFGVACDENPLTEEITSDTCLIGDLQIQPSETSTTVGSMPLKFTAAAYSPDGKRIEPSPHFIYSCNSQSVRFYDNGKSAWLTPYSAASSEINIKVKCYDCEGRAYAASAKVWVSSPTD